MVLRNVDFFIFKGEIVIVVGFNGFGKFMLMWVIIGVIVFIKG